MESSAVICELNPIHVGHKYIFERARERFGQFSPVIAVMSGSFTERATPAVYDKYTRAALAVKCGADIVVELPFPWSASGVENFALGGVSVASSLLAQGLTFGSETGEYEKIKRAAEIKDSAEFSERISSLGSGATGVAEDYERVMESLGVAAMGANDKLGVEYTRAGRGKIDSFHAVKRVADILSASEIRERIFRGETESLRGFIPKEAEDTVKNETAVDEKIYSSVLFYHARMNLSASDSGILRYASAVSKKSDNADVFYSSLATKRYTSARVRRELLFSILGAENKRKAKEPEYTVLLAVSSRGREYLSLRKKEFKISLITKPADVESLSESALSQYKLGMAADSLYSLCAGKEDGYLMKKHPFVGL